ncbi:MAG TPA: hypothetical protein VLT82_23405 [Myxococcaceae bacterium]|nr:hypothetical protein [Myxococcaceae bacterium]
MDERREQRIQPVQGGKCHAGAVHAEGSPEILEDDSAASAGNPDGLHQDLRIVPKEEHASALPGNFGPTAHGDSDVCLREGRSVVDAVTHHGDAVPLGAKLSHALELLLRQDLGHDVIDAEFLADACGNRRSVPGEKYRAEPQRLQASHCLSGLGPEHVGQVQSAEKLARPGDVDLRQVWWSPGQLRQVDASCPEEGSAPDPNLTTVLSEAGDSAARRVREALRQRGSDARVLRTGEDGSRERVLTGPLRNCRSLEQLRLLHALNRDDGDDVRSTEGHRSSLVQHDGVDGPERLERKAAFDDGPRPRRTSDGTQDGERRAGGDAARPGDDDHGNSGPSVSGDDECQCCGTESEVDQVTGKTVRDALDGRSILLGTLDGLEDSAERRRPAHARRLDLQDTGLVHRPREDASARELLDGERLARHAGLVDEGRPCLDEAVDWNPCAGPNEDEVPASQVVDGDLDRSSSALQGRLLRHEVEQGLDGVPSPRHRHVLEHFCHEDEEDDDARREGFADAQGRKNGDGHRQLHRHPTLQKGLEGLPVDGVAARHGRHNGDDVDAAGRNPKMEATHERRSRNEANSRQFHHADVVVAFCVVRSRRCDRPALGFVLE